MKKLVLEDFTADEKGEIINSLVSVQSRYAGANTGHRWDLTPERAECMLYP